jgi:hypothetical protein
MKLNMQAWIGPGLGSTHMGEFSNWLTLSLESGFQRLAALLDSHHVEGCLFWSFASKTF